VARPLSGSIPAAPEVVDEAVDGLVGDPVGDPAQGKGALLRGAGLLEEAHTQVAGAVIVALGPSRGPILAITGHEGHVRTRGAGKVCRAVGPHERSEAWVGLQHARGRVVVSGDAAGGKR